MTKLIKRFIDEDDGATAIEYGLIAALIAVAVIAMVRAVGTNLSTTFSTIADELPG
jgi:pilus assembly protein Flp/PilA